ncbi:MAG: heme oxygenase [Moraxellaceae bacterium]|nr:MAG: heme oxygenase [Moraxellaceae bacterium]
MSEAQQQLSTSEAAQPTRNARFISPVLAAVRDATKSQHHVLDKSMPLANPDANWADYVHHLQLLTSWLLPLEKWLSRFDDGPQGKEAPGFISYTDIIHADLGEAFIPVSDLWQNALQQPQSTDAAYRWGICYVIEGSQLGGEFLYKRLANRLSPHPLKYLQCKQAGRWPEFLKVMAREVNTQEHINNACEGAVYAFDALLLLLRAQEDIL